MRHNMKKTDSSSILMIVLKDHLIKLHDHATFNFT